MSRYRVRLLPRAKEDVAIIHAWLHGRSPQGAGRWLNAFEQSVAELEVHADTFASAPEDHILARDLKQIIFKTKHGRRYRAIYVCRESEVFILRVRGPGQPPLRDDEI